MPELRETLISLGDAGLHALVGPSCFRLISAIDERYVSLGHLADLILHRYGNAILLNADVRSALLNALRVTDAKTLAVRLGGEHVSDPYAALGRIRYRAGSSELTVLYDFFGIEEPPPETSVAVPRAQEEIMPNYALHDYQKDVVERAERHIRHPGGRVLIHMPTGSGKTRSAMYLLSRLFSTMPTGDGVIIWLAHSEELCEQAAHEFARCWTNHGAEALTIHRFYGANEVSLDELRIGFLVASLQKLYARSLTEQEKFLRLKKTVRAIVMDEAHQATAPTYEHLMEMLAPQGGRCSIVGLSATPGRSSLDLVADRALAAFFGGNKETLKVRGYDNPIEFLQSEGYLAQPSYDYIPYDVRVALTDDEVTKLQEGFDLPDRVIHSLGEDDQRNLLLLQRIMELVAVPSNKIIVFACSVSHAKTLADVLAVKGVAAASISSEDPGYLRKRQIEAFRDTDRLQVLVNFGVLTTGFDAPRTNVAIIARPTQSVVLYSQMVGRAMRGPRAGGNAHCKIVTVVDQMKGFRNIYEGFTHWDDVW